MVLTDELCDWLSATAREKSRALVLSVTLEAGGRPLLLLGILKREGIRPPRL